MMILKTCVAAIRIFVFLFFASAIGSMAIAQQDANVQQQAMTPVSGPSVPAVNGSTDIRKALVDRLYLMVYEAIRADNLSLCADDDYCLRHTRVIQSLRCVADICDGKDKSKEPLDCAKDFADQYSKEVQDQINSSLCSMVESPGAMTRKAYLRHVTDETEDEVVESGAYIMALKGSAESCEDYIKDYVGAYGPQWGPKWYRALSGCRILTGERPREQEEKDFYTWFGVLQGTGSCSDIINAEMRKACNAPQAASPVPSSAVPTSHA
ncbi:MAG: hypothetical protein HQL12_03880 [Candidatus Omnitrophica bacterium]|nr:hypothetical protein [Candidatus Omnitrophota bacterium]